jgi:hypothetical protein
MIGGVLALSLVGCESMGMMKQRGSAGTSATSSTSKSNSTDNGVSSQNSDATGWGINSLPSGQTTQ